ncbi:hypothetical protein F5884DRAFT_710046 [Xylogone sp. PMI_703]|nr:hypothetical protein F5884DRAFT_710046 [Xylogone sp. PMI_703]
MVELSVGDVAGLIALGLFIAQFLAPNLLLFFAAGFVKERETAGTWSVVGRTLQKSYWPEALATDATRSRGVSKRILLSAYAVPLIAILCAVTGVVTPLGLYQALEQSHNKTVPFAYTRDSSPFGIATPPRSNLPFSRTCSQGHGLFGQGPIPCPYSDTVVIFSGNLTELLWKLPYGYNTTVPQIVKDIYSSGTRNHPTISNFFDIQWRQYTLGTDPQKNNGSAFLVGSYRPIVSIVLNNDITAIEGLVVDTKTGGIGFRNHTLPQGLGPGAIWTEDLLFIEPETSCVNLNLSIDFTVNMNKSADLTPFTELNLVDHGGFAALNTTYPEYDQSDAQNNPVLTARAYKAAFLNNIYSMAYMNVTSLRSNVTGTEPFEYLKSYIGKKFPLQYDSSEVYDGLSVSRTYGKYLQIDSFENDNTYTNPFNITSENFDEINILCSGVGAPDIANISNIYVSCALIHGAPLRTDGGSPFRFEGGSKWTTPLYTCASALRATVKTVTFNLNGTSSLGNLYVKESVDKRYHDNASVPLWGVESSGLAMDGISPVWGIVDPAYEAYPNISLVRKPSLYLPGYYDEAGLTSGIAGGFIENLPGSDFGPYAMNSIPDSLVSPSIDYSGAQNMAIFLKWQNLSSTPEDIGSIINLIWTDLAAGAVVGTKGAVNPAGTSNAPIARTVAPIVNKIKYHVAFGIPAFILLFVLVLIILVALISAITGQSSTAQVRKVLHQTSPGRILTTVLYPEQSNLFMRTREWTRSFAKVEVDISEVGQPLKLSYGDSKSESVVANTREIGPEENAENNTLLTTGENVQRVRLAKTTVARKPLPISS